MTGKIPPKSDPENAAHTIERTDRCLRIRFYPGTRITRDLILTVLRQEFNLPISEAINDLWDLRGCIADERLNAHSIIQIVDFIKQRFHPHLLHKKTALVVGDQAGYGMTRMFQILAADLPYAVNIFENDTDALNWLSADPAADEQT